MFSQLDTSTFDKKCKESSSIPVIAVFLTDTDFNAPPTGNTTDVSFVLSNLISLRLIQLLKSN